MTHDLVPPLNDIHVASERGILFRVVLKDGVARSWLVVADNVDLMEATKQVNSTNIDREKAIFVKMTTGGIFYWSSNQQPHTFNSQLIHDDHYLSMYRKDI